MTDTFKWRDNLVQIEKDVQEIIRLKDKERHARYYQENRKKILKKQKKADEIRDRKSKEYYESNKERILAANNARYWNNVEERRRKAREYYQQHKQQIQWRRRMLTNEERIRALVGNIKNWSWDIYPKFSLDEEDAKALLEHFRLLEVQKQISENQ